MTRLGKMTPAGLAAFEKRKTDRTELYSYENQPEKLDADLERLFQKQTAAWDFFAKQAPSYRKTMAFWVMSAKQEATRFSRLNKLIEFSQDSKRVF